RRSREDLYELGAVVPRIEDFGRRQAAGRDGHAALEGRIDHAAAVYGADDEGRPGVDGAVNGIGIDDGARAEHETGGKRGCGAANVIDGAGHGHRDFERADVGLDERSHDVGDALRVGYADDG